MTRLPASKSDRPRDVFVMLHLSGLERITTALRMGDEFDMRDLTPLVQRSKAMIQAYEWRLEQMKEEE